MYPLRLSMSVNPFWEYEMSYFHLIAPRDVFSENPKANALNISHRTTLSQLGDPVLAHMSIDETNQSMPSVDDKRIHYYRMTDDNPGNRWIAAFLQPTLGTSEVLPSLFEELVLAPIFDRHKNKAWERPTQAVTPDLIMRHLLRGGGSTMAKWKHCEDIIENVRGVLEAYDIVFDTRQRLIQSQTLGFHGQEYRVMQFRVYGEVVFINDEYIDGHLPGERPAWSGR